MNINNILDDIISDLKSLTPSPPFSFPSTNYIPSYKLIDEMYKYKSKLYEYFKNIIKNTNYSIYDSNYYSSLLKRKSYVTSNIELMKNELDNSEFKSLKNIISQIDFIKSQDNTQFEQIIINSDNSSKIFYYLSKINLQDEYKYMEDFLNRKIIFEIQKPSEVEIINLRKMVNLLEINNSGSFSN